jgi:haloalkane dehalogenase
MTIEALRTPDDRFSELPGFAAAFHYADDLPGFEGLRLAYVDEGPADAEHTYLCLHGQPTWSYLYRKMLPVFVADGGRVVAPDFFGFGRSDKPADEATYTFDFHRDALLALVERLDLRGITLVVQDWGGLLGLTLPVAPGVAERVRRLIVMNTALAVGKPAGEGFEAWRAYVRSEPDLPIAALMQRAQPDLSPEEAAAYEAPFPDASFKAGVRMFPELVMTDPDMPGADVSRQAARFWRDEWRGPTFMAVGELDPVFTVDAMRRFAERIAGCPPPMVLEDAGHFVQERGDVVARAALEHFASG